ncbi:MAG TPA: FtsX-like permease family protein, partial [Opitutaceae bacterium]|nr:FtsX-like permease family protein [Opitutaceae bacterium]
YVNAFMVLALLLVAIGLYGTLSYLTRERTREIGIRLALGATRQEIRRIVVSQGLRWALIGSGIGMLGTLASASLLHSALYGVGAINLPALLAGLGLACAVAIFACWLPARRATRIDPMIALRSE